MTGSGRSTARDLSRYVPRVAIEWGGEPDHSWREVDGTLVFVDISGFTNLSERLTTFGHIGAEELTDVLDRVFGAMLDIAYSRRGSLLKFGGDALLLLFTGDDHALQACSAAVEMRSELRNASRIPTSVGRLKLKMSVGIHSGRIHLLRAGNSHTELLVTGPAASMTTDMEKTATAGQIVVSTATRDALPSGAARNATGPGWLLTWRKAVVDPPGPVPRAPVDDDRLLEFVPVRLRDHLRHGDGEPEHRSATIGFVRFSGVDAVLTTAGTEAAWQELNQLMTRVQEATLAEGVTILATDIDHDGGKVILATGVPTAEDDDEGRMLRAVRRIADSDIGLGLQIGVNSGHVYVGEIGTPYRCAYTVMGDTVNLAARLMAAAPHGAVYATPATLDRSLTRFVTSALEPLRVKGKAQPIQAYALGPAIATRHADATAGLPFVGRSPELATVFDAVADAMSGGGAVVTIVGPGGIGKTRLAREALGMVRDVSVLSLRAEPYGTAAAYRALRYPVRRLLGIDASDPATMTEQLVASVTALDAALVPWLPLLGDITHLEVAPTHEVDALEPRFRAARLADVLTSVLDRALPGPLVVLVDDAHWVDAASAEVLTRLEQRSASRPWSMVVTRRDETSGFVPTTGATVALGPLPTSDTEKLVIAASAAAPLRPHVVAAIVERSDGNPLYVEEIVRTVRASGGTGELPESLDATVAAQIDQLDPLPRHVVRIAAVLGRTFPRRVLQELLAGDRLSLDAATEAQLRDLVEPEDEHNLRFRHAILQEVAYEGLSYRRRRELHARAGEAIERVNADDPTRAADVLGLHFERAQRATEAWRYATAAGDAARRAYANAAAAIHYERALAASRHLDTVDDRTRAAVWTLLGDVREQAGEFHLALDAYRRASRLVAGDAVAEVEMLLKRARARERAGAFPSALREITAARHRIEGDYDDATNGLRARLLALRAVVLQAEGRAPDAIAAARAAVDVAVAAGEDASLAQAYAVLEWGHLMRGESEHANAGDRALELYERLEDLEGQGKILNTMGAAAYFRGDWDAAVRAYERARAIGLRMGNHVQAAISAMNIGEVLVNQERLDEAEPLLRDAIRVFQASAYADGLALAETYLGRLLLARGDVADAQACLERACEAFEALGVSHGALEASIHLADCRVQCDDSTGAVRLLDEAVARSGGDPGLFTASIARVKAAAFAREGDTVEAARLIAEGLEAADAHGLPYERELLSRLRDALVVDLRTGSGVTV